MREGEDVLTFQSRFLKKLAVFFLVAILVFNVIDALATLWVVHQGLAIEANPFLQAPMETGPLAFIAVKASLAGLGTYLMWRKRDHIIVLCGAYVCFVVYGALVVWFWMSLFS